MVVCKFFLQGTCRFGENCRFAHQVASQNAGNQPFIDNNSKKLFNPKTGTEIELSTLINSVQNDVVSGEKGRQWLLTCYAPFKEKPLYPGFVDMSFEEVRFGYIEAQKSNTIEQYNQSLQQLLAEAQARYKALQTPTKETVQMLKNIYNNSAFGQQNSFGGASIFGQQNAAQSNSGLFGQQNTGSVFGQQQNTNNIFRQMNATQKNGNAFGQQQTSIFGQSGNNLNQQQNGGSSFGQQSGSIFGQQSAIQSSGNLFGQQNHLQTGSIFSQQNTPQNTGNVFGQQNTNTIFGQQSNIFATHNNPQTSDNIFAQQKPTQNNIGVFGQVINTQGNNSIFGQQNNPQQTSHGFGQQNSIQSGANIFGQNCNNSTNSVFGTENKNLFNGPPQSGIFGNTQQQSNPIQAQPQNMISQDNNSQLQSFARLPEQTNPVNSNSIFQVKNTNTTSIFGLSSANAPSIPQRPSSKDINYGAYSKLEDLTEEEIKWFNSDVFDIHKIPEKPPTYEMCF